MSTSAVDAGVARYDNTIAGRVQRAAGRITSIDFVRGVVMVLMAIDHVRVYSGVPAGGPTPGVFFTRWITHFVAPGFVFLAGTSAYLHGRKLGDRRALSAFLLVRGALLVLLELTVIRVAWTFNLDFGSYMLAGVIWMIGWCMILMAAAVHLPTPAIAAIGIAIVALHNITDLFRAQLGAAFGDAGPGWLLKVLYFGGEVRLAESGPPLLVLYSIIPWIGVMMAGYAFGRVMELPAERRRAVCLRLGMALTILFVVLRAIDVYGNPRPWSATPGLLGFLSTAKYPASLQFLLMTLGPLLILLALAERWKGRLVETTSTFGRVPMFYYLLHIPVIHVAAMLVSLVREGSVNPWLFGNHPLAPPPVPDGYMWSLGLLYLVFAACVVVLYFPSRWFGRLRAMRRSKWLSYL
ncbi:MAG TPA: heparan-alpha-glucosaminide N-acetyltransferase domain-containing protein [Gemmatimonadaceae bacterium]|nr:heparan-alpha-glucosaminide N-acetyltransferase domain-containing protein [Gemmatimonadaceae bacterium]